VDHFQGVAGGWFGGHSFFVLSGEREKIDLSLSLSLPKGIGCIF